MYISPVDHNGEAVEAPWDAIKTWLAHGDAATDPHGVGGRRHPAAGGANDWDVTIRWINAINYDGNLYTVRANIHFSPAAIGGYNLGGIWMEGIAGVSENLNTPGITVAAIQHIAAGTLLGLLAVPLGNANW